MDLDVRLEEVKRYTKLVAFQRRKQFAHGECIRLHLQFVIFSGGVHGFGLPGIFEIKGELSVLRGDARRLWLGWSSRCNSVCFEVDDLDLDFAVYRARDQKLIDDAE